MEARIELLTRYPVKGLSGQNLHEVQLKPEEGFPGDRQFGFARPDSGFNPLDPKPLPKTRFYMLARDAQLALLSTEYDDETGFLFIRSPDTNEAFDLRDAASKERASKFLKTYLNLPTDETPTLFQASPHRFTDVSVVSREMMNAVSIINHNSVTALSAAIGQPVDVGRFRGNILIAGMPAFSELEKVGQTLQIGSARLRIVKRTKRCPATEVNLLTGERDLKIPKLLLQHFGHMDMGVYAEVVEGGLITPEDLVEMIE